MTISEQLQFSILSAPVACADRRALSQAWYSALYREQRTAVPSQAGPNTNAVAGEPHLAKKVRVHAPVPQQHLGPQPRRLAVRTDLPPMQERRAPGLYLARRIAHLAVTRAAKRSAATFVLDGTGARVRVLVTAKGGQVRLIAVCAKKHEARVAAALTQARYAAAASGIALQTARRGAVRC